ncbi:LysR family transcriptional regulator [Novosphingobium sp. FSY-8]|uniref:LysR family transcriptional regulator n=1 Tax=Novosphingobium ovatum TaxID=1908523 RepID=A0ABW9XDZ8_9SPHN|nr:LysR family transcriptional regulator [Novosphingobium ovatum]NBC36735.1 LysR family transcriptional regulator [Novosphingobium ovatum]
MPHLPDLEAWAIFAKVAQCGSFSGAADELGLAKTTVSKAVTRLETRMRTSLFHRTTRKLSLTESGRLSLERATRILADGAAIEADIAEEAASPRGLIRLASIAAVGVEALAPILPEFMAAYPDIEIDLVLTENQVDVVAEGYDAAIMVGHAGESGTLRSVRLSSLRRPLVAAPALLERLGMPEHPLDLPRYPAILPSHIPNSHEWQFARDGDADPIAVRMAARFRANYAEAMVPLMVGGIGIGLMAEYFVWEHLRDGRLIELLPEWSAPPGPLYLVTPPGRARPARVRVLLDFLRQRLVLRDGFLNAPR